MSVLYVYITAILVANTAARGIPGHGIVWCRQFERQWCVGLQRGLCSTSRPRWRRVQPGHLRRALATRSTIICTRICICSCVSLAALPLRAPPNVCTAVGGARAVLA